MKRSRAFTIVELLVVVAIIALLVGILMPAVTKARDHARLATSQSNLHSIGVAHQNYAREFNDRQMTLVTDGLASYGSNIGQAFEGYYQSNGAAGEASSHAGPILGWGYLDQNGPYRLFIYRTHETNDQEQWDGNLNVANCSLNLPISFTILKGFGAFRLLNIQQFHQYVGGRFYDPTFYAPKDTIVIDTVNGSGFGGSNCFEDPGEYCDRTDVSGFGEIPTWSSYCLSPAAMFNPMVFAHDDPSSTIHNGWQSPWQLAGGFRSPAYAQCSYPGLKTHVLEHHWLQNSKGICNPAFEGGTYAGCEPYYFNHGTDSVPMTLFYDGHVDGVGVGEAMRADARMRTQTANPNWGLWSRDTAFGNYGYYADAGYDFADTSFHILTTDGIRGRDVTVD